LPRQFVQRQDFVLNAVYCCGRKQSQSGLLGRPRKRDRIETRGDRHKRAGGKEQTESVERLSLERVLDCTWPRPARNVRTPKRPGRNCPALVFVLTQEIALLQAG